MSILQKEKTPKFVMQTSILLHECKCVKKMDSFAYECNRQSRWKFMKDVINVFFIFLERRFQQFSDFFVINI